MHRFLILLTVVLLGVAMTAAMVLASSSPTNGDFETGDLTGWTDNSEVGGFANVVEEGTCWSASNTLGLRLRGRFAANVRSSGQAPVTSIGVLTSDPFVAGKEVKFDALSEVGQFTVDNDPAGAANPVEFTVRILTAAGGELSSQVVATNIVTLSTGEPGIFCPIGDLTVGDFFGSHAIDTSAHAGSLIRIEFRQHTNVSGFGFFTLVDNVNAVGAPGACPNPASGFALADAAGSPNPDRDGNEDGFVCVKTVPGSGNAGPGYVVKDNFGSLNDS